MEPTTTAQLIPPAPPLFDEARLATGGFLSRSSDSTRSGYVCDLRHGSPGVPRATSTSSPCVESTSSCTPAGWRRTATSLGPRLAGGCRPWSSSTASRWSTGTWRNRRRSTFVVRRSTPSRQPLASTAWSSGRSWPRRRRPARWTMLWPASSACWGSVCRSHVQTTSSIRYERGHRKATVVGKGAKVAVIPLPPRVARSVDLAAAERLGGPVLVSRSGQLLDRHGATRIVRRVARPAGISKHISPHSLRHSFITAAPRRWRASS